MKTEAETEIVQLQAKECQGLIASPELGKSKEGLIVPRRLQSEHGPLTP